MDAAIALPAGFVVRLAHRLFLAIAEDTELAGGNTDPDQIFLGGNRTPSPSATLYSAEPRSSACPSMVSL